MKVEFKKTEDFKIPEELESSFSSNNSLRDAFFSLTPGRQRAYILYFSEPKQSKTRISRIEKYAEADDRRCGSFFYSFIRFTGNYSFNRR